MTCPSCNSPLESNARFCGVCGYRLAPNRPPQALSSPGLPRPIERVPRAQPGQAAAASAQAKPAPADPGKEVLNPSAQASKPGIALPPGQLASPGLQGQPGRGPAKSRTKSADDIYLNEVLNNRFKVESKIGEGGFGAVYRGVQLATGRKVALKLLHPEMTKDENLVARFRREGMVLCNLRDAHTITTYDFDQTPNGTLYIAMELLEGKSLHQLFHEEAPLGWKRMFKILTEMCSSLAEAHAQGIIHRDLKPENIYLETRSGNPEFVKILDFGIAKVMRGDTIDPQAPQLTATGQTLGTLEYMSPEQLMGKPLDGRSDVYALGVLAYEMITGRLPFPEAKGPAGLITAQLKQTPVPPSQANPKATLPKAADRAILKCLEKDKNSRYPDVSALAAALQDVLADQSSELAALKQLQIPIGANRQPSTADMLETRRGDLPNLSPPPLPTAPVPGMQGVPGMSGIEDERSSGIAPMGGRMPPAPTPAPVSHLPAVMTPATGSPFAPQPMTSTPYPMAPGGSAMQGGAPMPMGMYPPVAHYPQLAGRPLRSSKKIIWWVLALLVIGAGVGTAMALLFGK